jgi:hypothetical protein
MDLDHSAHRSFCVEKWVLKEAKNRPKTEIDEESWELND